MRQWPSAALFVWILAGGLLTNTPPATASPAGSERSFFEDGKLTPPVRRVADKVGSSVALGVDTAVVGAPGIDFDGAALIFERDAGGPGNWGQVATLTPSDPGIGSEFGSNVAISVDTIILGDSDTGFRPGATYVFERDAGGSGEWGEVARLTASDGKSGDNFGDSVAISGDVLVVGATSSEPGFFSGSAYVFERDVADPRNWEEVAKLTAADGGDFDFFGASVAISGDTVAVGGRDTVSVFERDAGGPGNWGQVANFEREGAGDSVALSRDRLAVGAVQDDDLGFESGAAYIFERGAGAARAWREVAKLTAPDGRPREYFGRSVSISGDTVVVGTEYADIGFPDEGHAEPGAAYIFARDAGGPGKWGKLAKLEASDGVSFNVFGRSVGISGDTVLVGAYGDPVDSGCGSPPCYNAGSAYIFEETGIDPALTVLGVCPGKVTLTASSLTPRGRLALFGGFTRNTFALPSGFCVGTELGIDEPGVLQTTRADDAGGKAAAVTLSEQQCGALLQLVDATSCATSAVVQLP